MKTPLERFMLSRKAVEIPRAPGFGRSFVIYHYSRPNCILSEYKQHQKERYIVVLQVGLEVAMEYSVALTDDMTTREITSKLIALMKINDKLHTK